MYERSRTYGKKGSLLKKCNGKKNVDAEYVKVREENIPEAERYANEQCGANRPEEKTSEQWAAEWNRVFHDKMEELVRAIHQSVDTEWIVGSEACRQYIQQGSWETARRWCKRYNAPLRRWIDGRPVFLKKEIDAWLITTGNEIREKERMDREIRKIPSKVATTEMV